MSCSLLCKVLVEAFLKWVQRSYVLLCMSLLLAEWRVANPTTGTSACMLLYAHENLCLSVLLPRCTAGGQIETHYTKHMHLTILHAYLV